MSTGRGRRVLTLIGAALLVVPVVEVLVIIAVGRAIGGWPTFGLLVLESSLGAWLVRREGSRAWAGLRSALSTGRMPAGELADAALVLIGGTLLLAPGFVTDVVGLFFVLPLTRPAARRILARAVERRLVGARPWAYRGRERAEPGEVIDGQVVDEPGRRRPESPGGDDGAGRTG